MNDFLSINPENKSGRIKLNDVVIQPVMDDLIQQIGKIFGASAAASGAYSGELTNCAENAIDTLEIVIHSPGGSVLDGYTLYNEINSLRARGVHVTATIDSLAASMASVICMACDVVRMVPTGQMMIHEVSQGIRGNATDLRKAADLCEEMSSQIAEIYAGRTGISAEETREMMKQETWMSAKTALAKGFIDEVFDIRQQSRKPEGMSLLSKLFPGNDEVSKLEASILENDTLRADLEVATSRISELTSLSEANAALQSDLVSITEDRDSLVSQVETKDAEISLLKTEVEAAKASAGEQAIEALAAIGQAKALDISDDLGSKDAGILAKYEALEGAEKWKFLRENSIEIADAYRKQSTSNSN